LIKATSTAGEDHADGPESEHGGEGKA